MPMGIGPGLSVTRFESGIPGWMTGMDLGWDFTQNVQYSGATNPTDTHSATIYAQSAAGVWSPFAANTLVRTDLGLQTVPTRTNLAVQSFTTSSAEWSYSACSAVAGQTGPLPFANDAALITCTAVAGSSFVTAANTTLVSYTSGTTYTFSRFVKAGTQTLIQLSGPSAAFGSSQYANFNLTTGAMVGSAGIVASGINSYQGGWYRIWIAVTATATASTNGGLVAFINNASDTRLPAVTLTTTFTVTGAQVEVGSFPSPPIVTTSSAATVTGDRVVFDLTGKLGSGVGVIMQFNPLDITAQFKQPISFNDGTANNYLNVYLDTGGGTPLSQIVNATVNQGNVTMPGANATGVQTWVIAAGPNYHRTQKIGQAASTTDTTVSWPTTLSKMNIGGHGYSAFDNMYQLTRQIGLKFGAANDAMFNDLVAKATILNAVS